VDGKKKSGKCVRAQGDPRVRVKYVSTSAYIISENLGPAPAKSTRGPQREATPLRLRGQQEWLVYSNIHMRFQGMPSTLLRCTIINQCCSRWCSSCS